MADISNKFAIGVGISEVPSKSLTVEEQDIDALCVMGKFNWGPINKITEHFDIDSFFNMYGNKPNTGSEAWLQVYAYKILNPGRRVVVNRLAHYTDITDETTLDAVKSFERFEDEEAEPASTLVDGIYTASDPTIALIDGSSFPLAPATGTIMRITEGVTTEDNLYQSRSGNTLTLAVGGLANSYTAAAVVQLIEPFGADINAKWFGKRGDEISVEVTQTNKVSTTTIADLEDAGESVALQNSANINIGEVLKIGTTDYVMVTEIQDNIIFFSAITLGSTIVSGAVVISLNLTLDVYVLGKLKETWEDLSMWSENTQEFIETVVNTGSIWIDVDVDEANQATTFNEQWLKATGAPVPLTGGSNGSTVVDADAIGNIASKTGFNALDLYKKPVWITQPDFTTAAVQQAMAAYAKLKRIHDSYADVPYGLNEIQAKNYFDNLAALNTSYSRTHWPNMKITDPVTAQPILIHNSGSFIGKKAQVSGTPGQGVWNVAAGLNNGVANGIIGLEEFLVNGEVVNPTDDDDVITRLQQSHINSIVRHPSGNFLFWGSRTMDKSTKPNDKFEHMNQRDVFRLVESSLQIAFERVLFENNDESTRTGVTSTVRRFLVGLMNDGAFPFTDSKQAFSVKCDAENNPLSVVQQGLLVCEVQLSKQTPINRISLIFSGKVQQAA